MLTLYTRRPLICRAITVGIGWAGLFIACGTVQAQEIECAVATNIANRAYDRVFEATKYRNFNQAQVVKQGFWDIEEYSANCPGVRDLAKVLVDYGYGRGGESTIGPDGIASSTSRSVPRFLPGRNSDRMAAAIRGDPVPLSGLAPNSTVLSIHIEPLYSDDATAASGSTAVGRIYRVRLRKDDGSTMVITQKAAPAFAVGDRVNITGGVIRREAARGY